MSLLKGVSEQPLENLADLDAVAFNALSDVNKFLINDTLLTYALKAEDFPYELDASGEEKFPLGPRCLVNLSGQMSYNVFVSAGSLIIRRHLQLKCLLQPPLIIPFLEHADDWSDYIYFLVKIIRERGRWLCEAKPEWHWWKEALNPGTMEQKDNANRYLYFRLLRSFRREEANSLLVDLWNKESKSTKQLFVELLREHLSEGDVETLTRLWNDESGTIRNEIRKLIFFASKNDEFIRLKNKLSSLQVPGMKTGELTADMPFVSEFYDAGTPFPAEWSAYLAIADDGKKKSGNDPLAAMPEKASERQRAFGDVLYASLVDGLYEKLGKWVSRIWSDQPAYRLGSDWTGYFNLLEEKRKNELLQHVIHHGDDEATVRFTTQLLSRCLVEMDKESTAVLLRLVKKVLQQNKCSLDDVWASGVKAFMPFVIHENYLGDWVGIFDLIGKKTGKPKTRNSSAETLKLITFRRKIDTCFHESAK